LEGGFLMIYGSMTELLRKAGELDGKTLSDINTSGKILNGRMKKDFEEVVRKNFFDYNIESKNEGNPRGLSIELKVIPLIKNKSGFIMAKERLLLNSIDYQEEVK